MYLNGYWIDKNDVTVAQYRQFCQENNRAMPEAPSWGWQDHDPIVNVSWDDAKAYAEWAGMALPTEAEWEKAARGTDGRAFPWGDDWDTTKCNSSSSRPTPVGSYPAGASPYGCLDMAGNVWQWCADWYDGSYYQRAPANNPAGADMGSSSASSHVMRGGDAKGVNAKLFLVTYRCPGYRCDTLGFRCVFRLPGK